MTGALIPGLHAAAAVCLQANHYGNRSGFFKMETQTRRWPRRLFSRIAGVVAAGMLSLAAISTARADATSELASFSVFNKVDLAQLSQGDQKPVRGPGGGRYLSVQTAYVVPRPPSEQLAAMRQWNPARHGELKVFIHSEISGSPGPGSFS
ncbi:MAG TPA: hypothetical protein VF551_03855, partial [Chthoniobacterales bacterium]